MQVLIRLFERRAAIFGVLFQRSAEGSYTLKDLLKRGFGLEGEKEGGVDYLVGLGVQASHIGLMIFRSESVDLGFSVDLNLVACHHRMKLILKYRYALNDQ